MPQEIGYGTQTDVKGRFFTFGREKIYLKDLIVDGTEFDLLYIAKNDLFLGINIEIFENKLNIIVTIVE